MSKSTILIIDITEELLKKLEKEITKKEERK